MKKEARALREKDLVQKQFAFNHRNCRENWPMGSEENGPREEGRKPTNDRRHIKMSCRVAGGSTACGRFARVVIQHPASSHGNLKNRKCRIYVPVNWVIYRQQKYFKAPDEDDVASS